MDRMIGRTLKVRALKDMLGETQMLYLSGYFSSGKTVLLKQLQAVWTGTTAFFSCRRQALTASLLASANGAALVLLDDLGDLDAKGAETLIQWLEALPPDVRVVLSGRGKLPEMLNIFFISGRLHVLDRQFICFDKEETQQFLLSQGLTVDSEKMAWLMKNSQGWILVIALIVRYHIMNPAMPLDELIERAGIIVRECWDSEVFSRLDETNRLLLRNISVFDRITPALARAVTGIRDAEQRMRNLEHSGGYLSQLSWGVYTIGKPIRRLLQEKLLNEMDDGYLNRIYCAAAAYYEHENRLPEALDCYRKAGKNNEIARSLEAHSHMRPGNGFYTELESYYFMLDDALVRNSPSLMEGMSILFSL